MNRLTASLMNTDPVTVSLVVAIAACVTVVVKVLLYMQKRDKELAEKFEKRMGEIEADAGEIRSNYLDRFAALTSHVNDVKVNVAELRSDVKNIMLHLQGQPR